MSIELADAKNLRYGEYLVDSQGKRWKVNGQVTTWKTDERRIRVPLKHGLYAYSALKTEHFNASGVCDIFSRET